MAAMMFSNLTIESLKVILTGLGEDLEVEYIISRFARDETSEATAVLDHNSQPGETRDETDAFEQRITRHSGHSRYIHIKIIESQYVSMTVDGRVLNTHANIDVTLEITESDDAEHIRRSHITSCIQGEIVLVDAYVYGAGQDE